MHKIESDIENRLVRAVKKSGGMAYKFVSPGNAGVPDRIVITKDGRLIFVELKTEIGVLSKQQKAQIKRLSDLGQSVVVLYGEGDVDDFVREVIGDI